MEIPSGILGLFRVLFKPIADFFSKLLFYRAYEVSTLYRYHRDAFGIPPTDLTKDIEYRVIWKEYHLRTKLTIPMIWVKAKDGRAFSKLVLSVIASNDKIKYQDYITLLNVSSIPVQASLPSIPFRRLKFKGGIYTPYNDIQVRLLEAYEEDGNNIDLPSHNKDRFSPFDNLAVALGQEMGDVEKWGEVFNLEFIEMGIKEQRINLLCPHLGKPDIVSRIKVRLYEMKWLIKIIFWSKNIVTAKQLTKELTKYLDEYENIK